MIIESVRSVLATCRIVGVAGTVYSTCLLILNKHFGMAYTYTGAGKVEAELGKYIS